MFQDNTLVIKNKGETRKPKMLLKSKYHFPSSSYYTESPTEFEISSQNHTLTPYEKIQYDKPYKSIQKETNAKTFQMMLLESNRERMIHFKKA